MTNDELLAKIREGLGMQIEEAVTSANVSIHDTHMAAQSWLLLQILDKLEDIRVCVIDIEQEVSKLNPDYK